MLDSPWPNIEVPLVSVPHFLLERLRFHGNKEFIIEDETGNSYTFHQLANDSLRFARALISSGIQERDHLGIIGLNNYEFVVTLIAGLITGAIVVPISAICPIDEIYSKVKQRNVKLLTVATRNYKSLSNELLKKYKDGLKEIISFCENGNSHATTNEEFSRFRQKLGQHEVYNELHVSLKTMNFRTEPCMIIESSGLNQSKGCLITHHNLIAHLSTSSLPLAGLNWNGGDVVLNSNPFHHITGLTQLLVALNVGAKLVIVEHLNAKTLVSCVEKWKISAAILTPTTIIDMIKDESSSNELVTLKKVISTGAAISTSLASQFVNKFDIEDYRQAYGLTELTGFIAIEPSYSDHYEYCGVPVPLTQIKIIDTNSSDELGLFKVGEICLKSPQLCSGYYNDADKIFEKMIDEEGWFHTGDVGFLNRPGKLRVIDRMVDFINLEDVKISPTAIESILLNHEAVREAVVVGIDYENDIQIPTAFVVLNKNVPVKQIEIYIEEYLEKQDMKLTGGVYAVSELPKNCCGIIVRNRLKKYLFDN